MVDNLKIPGFKIDIKSGLDFGLCKLMHRSSKLQSSIKDNNFYLTLMVTRWRWKWNAIRVSLLIWLISHLFFCRCCHCLHPDNTLGASPSNFIEWWLEKNFDKGYYDKNIMPLLSVLNLVSISILTLDADCYFQWGLMSLNIAFIEVGLRMSLDSHLPSVCCQIKLQWILNFFFYSILSIVLESCILRFPIENGICLVESTRKIDLIWVIFLLGLQLVYTSFDRLQLVKK